MSYIFMEIDDIKGNATTTGYVDQIDIEEFQLNVQNTLNDGSNNSRTQGTPKFGDIALVKTLDSASVLLFGKLYSGSVIEKITLHFTKIVKNKAVDFMTLELGNCIITSMNTVADFSQTGKTDSNPGLEPREHITINYQTIEETFTKYDKDGNAAGPLRAGYNVLENEQM